MFILQPSPPSTYMDLYVFLGSFRSANESPRQQVTRQQYITIHIRPQEQGEGEDGTVRSEGSREMGGWWTSLLGGLPGLWGRKRASVGAGQKLCLIRKEMQSEIIESDNFRRKWSCDLRGGSRSSREVTVTECRKSGGKSERQTTAVLPLLGD